MPDGWAADAYSTCPEKSNGVFSTNNPWWMTLPLVYKNTQQIKSHDPKPIRCTQSDRFLLYRAHTPGGCVHTRCRTDIDGIRKADIYFIRVPFVCIDKKTGERSKWRTFWAAEKTCWTCCRLVVLAIGNNREKREKRGGNKLRRRRNRRAQG